MKYITPITFVEEWNGNKIYIKRDDLLPFSFGGNKVRIANEYFEDMKLKGADCIISYGNIRSNMNRAVANMAACKNVECHIIVPEDETLQEAYNSKMAKMCGSHIHRCNGHVADCIEQVMKQIKNKGKNPYYIFGNKFGKGNELTGVNAYKKVYDEIIQQFNERLDYIFVSTGTGITQSGLMLGKKLSGRTEKIVGISIARESEAEEKIIKDIIGETPQVVDDYLAGGYAKYDEEIKNETMRMFIKYGIPMDTTYTGKGWNGMKKYLQDNNLSNNNCLFIHTGGTPLFFDNNR